MTFEHSSPLLRKRLVQAEALKLYMADPSRWINYREGGSSFPDHVYYKFYSHYPNRVATEDDYADPLYGLHIVLQIWHSPEQGADAQINISVEDGEIPYPSPVIDPSPFEGWLIKRCLNEARLHHIE